MGFDVYGLRAVSERGKYFRNNIWWWRPLAEYVGKVMGSELKGNGEGWFSNDGHKVSEQEALKISARLSFLIRNGDTRKYSIAYAKLSKGKNPQYPFSVSNVREFAKFARDSGGFEIC